MSKIWRATFKCRLSGGTLVQNSLHFVTQVAEFGSEPSAADIAAMVQAGSPSLLGLYLSACPTDLTCDSIDVVECTDPSDFEAVPEGHSAAVNANGFVATGAQMTPDAMVGIISLKTGVPRRWARGNLRMPSPHNTTYLSAGGKWTGTYKTNCETFASHLDDNHSIGSVNPTDVLPIVYSRTQHARGASQPWSRITAAVFKTDPRWLDSRTTAP